MDGLKITLGVGATSGRHKGHVSSECDGLSFVVISRLKTNVFLIKSDTLTWSTYFLSGAVVN